MSVPQQVERPDAQGVGIFIHSFAWPGHILGCKYRCRVGVGFPIPSRVRRQIHFKLHVSDFEEPQYFVPPRLESC